MALAVWTLLSTTLLAGCAGKNGNDRNVVYEDMKAAFEQSGLLSANIGLFSKTEENGSVSYGEGGSGVIIKRDGRTYYALTAAHVVSVENAQLLVFTVNTDLKSESIPGVDLNVLSTETYDAMYTAEIEHVSKRDDLAVISFQTDEDLAVIALAEKDPEKNDRIMCIGNPQNEWFAVSYGRITSGVEKFGESKGFPSNAMKHSAYIQFRWAAAAARRSTSRCSLQAPRPAAPSRLTAKPSASGC